MRQSAILDIAEKYKGDAQFCDREVIYEDARIRPGLVVIPIKPWELADDLSGFLAWHVPVNIKNGKLGKAVKKVWNTPTDTEFLRWATDQPARVLRTALAAQGIKARGSIVKILAYRLTFLYQDALWKRVQARPLDPEKKYQRMHYEKALDMFLNTRGVRDEQAILLVRFYSDHQEPSVLRRIKELSVIIDDKKGRDTEETGGPSEIMKRLKNQAGNDENGKEDKEKKGKGRSPDTETEAVKAGKGDKPKAKAPEETKPKGVKKAPEADPPETEQKEKEDMATATAKKGGKKEKKDNGEGRKTWTQAASKREFPEGAKVKYLGRNKQYNGKTAVVVGVHKEDPGVNIKFSDGDTLAVGPNSLQRVGK